jgi:lysophospholipase L1-like esterase
MPITFMGGKIPRARKVAKGYDAGKMKAIRIFLLLSALLAAWSAGNLWRDRKNTLENYPLWKSVKTELALGVNGARSFTVTPVSLAGRALNLGAWHGHQEVALMEAWEGFPEIRLRVLALGAAEWSLVAHSLQGQQSFALRLSTGEAHPSAWIRLGDSLLFAEKRPIPYRLPMGRWVEVTVRQADGRLEAFAQNERIGAYELPPGPWRFSLRGHSDQGVLRVDDLSFRLPHRRYEESFSGSFSVGLFAALAAALFGFFFLLELMAGAWVASGAALVLAMLPSLLFLFFELSIGRRYPLQVDLRGYPSNIETRDQALERLSSSPSPGKPVLLWLGGSQAWGAGASQDEKSLFGHIKAKVCGYSLECVNGAISGATLEDQLEVLRLVSTRRVVKVVVITAAVNDSNNPEFPAKLALVADAVEQRGAKLLLVPEPTEGRYPTVTARQDEIKKFATEKSIPFVDLPEVMERAADSGFLWWDFVHLSDGGAAVAAQAMVPALQTLLGKIGLGQANEQGSEKRGKR